MRLGLQLSLGTQCTREGSAALGPRRPKGPIYAEGGLLKPRGPAHPDPGTRNTDAASAS